MALPGQKNEGYRQLAASTQPEKRKSETTDRHCPATETQGMEIDSKCPASETKGTEIDSHYPARSAEGIALHLHRDRSLRELPTA